MSTEEQHAALGKLSAKHAETKRTLAAVESELASIADDLRNARKTIEAATGKSLSTIPPRLPDELPRIERIRDLLQQLNQLGSERDEQVRLLKDAGVL